MSRALCKLCRRCGLAMLTLTLIQFMAVSLSGASAETRSLKLYFVHTNERAEIVFWRDGQYVQAGLRKLNVFLRDWRRNEATNMDPRLFTLIWSVYQASGSRAYIHVISGYRSPATNNMLRLRSANSGVAKLSQHTLGRAMDFYLPDVNLATLRKIGLKQEVGGVGYYPKSGSPFVHMDVGHVRHWPRMSRKELLALFPDGKTQYIPSDGKPLAGYALAKADYQSRKGAPIYLAANSSEKKTGLLATLLGRKEKNVVQPTAVPDLDDQPIAAPDRNPSPATSLAAFLPNNVPVPVLAPERGQLLTPEDGAQPTEPLSETATIASVDIPVPEFKEVANSNPSTEAAFAGQSELTSNSSKAANDNNRLPPDEASESKALNAEIGSIDNKVEAGIPIPQSRPESALSGLPLAAILENGGGQPADETIKIEAPVATGHDGDDKGDKENASGEGLSQAQPEDRNSKVDLETLVSSDENDVIPVPDDDGVDEEEDNNMGALDGSDDISKTTLGPTDQVTVASLLASSKPGEKTPKPSETDIEQIVADTKPIAANSNINPDMELRQIPNLVFLSGLQKNVTDSRYTELTGKAINFRSVARVY